MSGISVLDRPVHHLRWYSRPHRARMTVSSRHGGGFPSPSLGCRTASPAAQGALIGMTFQSGLTCWLRSGRSAPSSGSAASFSLTGLGGPPPPSSARRLRVASWASSPRARPASYGFFASGSAGLAADGNAELFIYQLLVTHAQLVTHAPSGLSGPAGFASDGNSDVVSPPLCALRTGLGPQASSGLLDPAGFAADDKAEFSVPRLLAFGTDSACRRLGPPRPGRHRLGRQLRVLHLPAAHVQAERHSGVGWPLRPRRLRRRRTL